MIIHIIPNGKILKEKLDLTIPDFTVLTGGNGSGKTQLLEYLRFPSDFEVPLKNSSVQNQDNLRIVSPIMDYNGNKLWNVIFSSPGIMDAEKEVLNQKPLITQVKEQWLTFEPIARSYSLIKDKQFDNEQIELSELNNAIIRFDKNLTIDTKYFDNKKFKKSNLQQLKKLKEVGAKASKTIDELYFIDFLIFYRSPTKLFSSALDLLFHQFYLKSKYYPHLTKDVTPPWKVFNQILDKAKFRYRTKYSPSNNEEYPPAVRLIDNETGIENVTFNSLSSGEKTIMSLIFVLYHASNFGKFPEVVLFDEPDAHLHPSLTDLFLSVIQEVLVKKHNVKVILTTHSPSTVALAPEASIYRMDRTLGYPFKESKSKALQSLTNGLPYLSINYEDRRQIFVESDYDVEYYEKIYSILKPFLNSEISLNFISSGNSKKLHNGSCSQVKKITSILRESGNNTVWGIVDYDGKNESNNFIKVLGEKERYTFENFILDPLLVSALLIREKIIIKDYFGLESNENYYDFKSFNSEKLQKIVNQFFMKFENEENQILEEVELLNGIKIEIPKWYLHYQGHDLEDKLLEIFPKLNSIKRQKEKALKVAIIEKVIDDIPEIMPKAFFNIFSILQQ